MPWSNNSVFQLIILIPTGGFTGQFVYTPQPGNGNLIASTTAQSGTDPYGNAYLEGITNYFQEGPGEFFVVQMLSGGLEMSYATSAAGPYIQAAALGLGFSSFPSGPYVALNPALLVGSGLRATSALAELQGSLAVGTSLGRAMWVAPSGDTSGVTDGASITAALSAARRAILLPGTFYTNQIIALAGNTTLEGAMGNEFAPSRLLMANGANLDAVIASTGWSTSSNTTSVTPVTIRNLQVDANQANQTGGQGHGIVLQSYGSRLEDLTVMNTRGDGIRFDFFGANGTTGITNTMDENRIIGCKIIGPLGIGIHTTDPAGNSAITDGFIDRCIVDGQGAISISGAIVLQASAGWLVRGCHVYGLTGNGINCQRPFSTRIVNNYIEPFGTNAAVHFYSGISANNAQDLNAAIIVGNTVRMLNNGAVGSTLLGIDCETGNGQTASFTVVGNQIHTSAAVTVTHYGIYVQNNNSAATTNVVTTGNNVIGTFTAASPFLVTNGGVINHTAGV